MSSLIELDAYIEARLPLPDHNLAWRLYGAGLDRFGDDGHPAVLPMPSYGDDELLARVDHIGQFSSPHSWPQSCRKAGNSRT